jgi:hypothetical protein
MEGLGVVPSGEIDDFILGNKLVAELVDVTNGKVFPVKLGAGWHGGFGRWTKRAA